MLQQLLNSGFRFRESEQQLAFRIRVFNTALLVATIFAPLVAFLHFSGVGDITNFHAYVNLFYGASSLAIFFWLRRGRRHYFPLAVTFVCLSFAVFVSALWFAIRDEFRPIWFYLLVLATYVLLPLRWGDGLAISSVLAIFICNYLQPLGISEDALRTVGMAMVPYAAILRAYSRKHIQYLEDLHNSNIHLRELASKDALTQIYNRRMFYELGERLFTLSRRQNQPLSLLFVDLDHFKQINDEYGHHAGDEVLRSFSIICKRLFRSSDIIARIGGEEFVILLPNTTLNGANALASKLLRQLDQAPLRFAGLTIEISSSIGIAELNEFDGDLDQLKRRADEALYDAKNSGRKRAVLAKERLTERL